MSYVLHIWDKPVPTTAEEADQIASALGKQPRTEHINPKYIEAANQLTARYPFNEDPDIASDEIGEVWSEGPLVPQRAEPLWGVGILSQYIKEVQPFVVSTCTALGLVVYDVQLGKAYLPGGVVLSAKPLPIWEAKKPWWKFW